MLHLSICLPSAHLLLFVCASGPPFAFLTALCTCASYRKCTKMIHIAAQYIHLNESQRFRQTANSICFCFLTRRLNRLVALHSSYYWAEIAVPVTRNNNTRRRCLVIGMYIIYAYRLEGQSDALEVIQVRRSVALVGSNASSAFKP